MAPHDQDRTSRDSRTELLLDERTSRDSFLDDDAQETTAPRSSGLWSGIALGTCLGFFLATALWSTTSPAQLLPLSTLLPTRDGPSPLPPTHSPPPPPLRQSPVDASSLQPPTINIGAPTPPDQSISHAAQRRSHAIISAVSSPERLLTVQANLQRLPPSAWGCTVCTWNDRVYNVLQRASASASSDVAEDVAARYIVRRCSIVYRHKWKWASLLNATTQQEPTTLRAEFVLVLLDDVNLGPPATFDIAALTELARRHQLSVISPIIPGASNGMMHSRKTDRSHVANHSAEVRLTNTLEVYASLYTGAAWRCLTTMFNNSILHTESDAVGYGYDHCFRAHCGGRQGLALTQTAQHLESYYNDRAKSAASNRSVVIDAAGRRLALAEYNLEDTGMKQMKKLSNWVWRMGHKVPSKRCATMAPQHRYSMVWYEYV